MEYIKHLKLELGKKWHEVVPAYNKAFRCKVSKSTIMRHYYKNTEKEERVSTSEQIDNNVDDLMCEATSRENTKLIKQLKAEKVKTQKIVDAIYAAVSKRKIKPIKPPRISKKKKQHDLEMHLLRSDAQVGEVVDAKYTSGLGSYNYETYQKRLSTLLDKTMTFYEQDHESLGLNKLVIPMLGDQVEGENIYKGQAHHIDKPLIDQVVDSAYHEVNNFFLPLAQVFPSMELFCVRGNHGRGGKKGENHEATNWDYTYYKIVQILLQQAAPHIKVFTTQSPTMIVQHGKFIFAYNHFDGVNGWNGIPYYGLNRMASRVGDMHRLYIDYHVGAHFHTPSNLGGRIFINGTLVGGSNLSINNMHLTSLPSQKLFYFHPEHGINRDSDLHLDKPVVLQPDSNGIFTPID